MFEAHVSHLLKKYLGDYVQGLSAEALRISVWKGDVLRDLQLKAEALNSLKLPVIVKGGFIGTITLKVPWKILGKELVIVIIDHVFILVHPALMDGHSQTAGSKENLRVIECLHESHQALEIYASIEQAMNTFGPNHFKEMKKRKVKKPYSPSGASESESGLKEVLGVWTGQETMLAVPISSTFGTLGSAETQSQSQLGKEH